MAFTDQRYVTWQPNKSVVQFFNQLKNRRVPEQNNSSSSVRMTTSSPPSHRSVPKAPSLKVNYASPSESMVSTARALSGGGGGSTRGNKRSYKRKRSLTRHSDAQPSTSKRRKSSSKKKAQPSKKKAQLTPTKKAKKVLEKRLRNIKL